MKRIDIGFSKSKKFSLFSYITRVFDRTKFSHVFVTIHSKNLTVDNQLIYHADKLSVHFLSKKNFKVKNKIVRQYTFFIKDQSYYSLMNYAVDHAGKPYGFLQLFGLLIVKCVGKVGFKMTNPFGEGTYICTELVAEILENYLDIGLRKELNDITLKDIEFYLEKHAEGKRINQSPTSLP